MKDQKYRIYLDGLKEEHYKDFMNHLFTYKGGVSGLITCGPEVEKVKREKEMERLEVYYNDHFGPYSKRSQEAIKAYLRNLDPNFKIHFFQDRFEFEKPAGIAFLSIPVFNIFYYMGYVMALQNNDKSL